MSKGNFKVKCTSNSGSNEKCYTIGKIYEVKDGKLTTDNGVKIPQLTNINTFEEWQDFSSSKWELVPEPSREIITIHRKKKSVVATITDGVNTYSQFTKLSDASGDFKTAVKMVVERLMDKWKVEDKTDDVPLTAEGFKVGDRIIKVGGVHDGELGKITDASKLITVMLDSGVEWKCHDYEIKPFEEKETSFDWDGFKQGKFAVHCDTEEKAREFLKECDEQGIKWCTGTKISDQKESRWEHYKERTAYRCDSFGGLMFGIFDERSKIDYTPSKSTVKEVKRPAKVGDKIKLVKDSVPHITPTKIGDEQTVKEVSEDGVLADNNNFYYDGNQEYIILDSTSDKPVSKPLSEYTNRELSAELLRRCEQEAE